MSGSEGDSLIGSGGSRRKFQVFEECVRPIVAEGFCTMMFVFIGVMASYPGELLAAALAHGLTISLLVISFGHISGAHINPAVTLAALISGAISWPMAIFYVAAQLGGSILGAGIAAGCLSFTVDGGTTAFVSINGGGQLLMEGVSVWQGLLIETMLTALLVNSVLLAAVDSDGTNALAPLAIGFTVAADILAGAIMTGASMNPARTFGPAVVASGQVDLWTNQWIYWLGPALGSAIIACLYKAFFARADKRWCIKQD